MEYYLAIQKNEVLIRAPTGMNHEKKLQKMKEARNQGSISHVIIYMKYPVRWIHKDSRLMVKMGWEERGMERKQIKHRNLK